MMSFHINLDQKGTRAYLKRLIIRIGLFVNFLTNYKTILKRSYKSIPIIIISFNQLKYIKRLVDYLQSNGYQNIVIIDNASSYPPLIAYFKEIENQVTIHRLDKNYGHRVFWEKKEFLLEYAIGYYVITDPDIVPEKNCPDDFILYFKDILKRNKKINKVGFSLRIDNIPDSNPHKEEIIKWEEKFWVSKDHQGNYLAPIDTTFALYRPRRIFYGEEFYKAIRTKSPYTAVHYGWLIDPKKLSEEQQFYAEQSKASYSWRTNAKGELINRKYLQP